VFFDGKHEALGGEPIRPKEAPGGLPGCAVRCPGTGLLSGRWL